MIYVCTKDKKIEQYWLDEYNEKYGVKIVDLDFLYFNQDFKKDDLYILDIDQFETLDNIVEYFHSIPKDLPTVALLEEPRLGHGAYLIKTGFKSYLGKKTTKLIVNQALKTVLEGNIWLYPELMNYIIKHINTNHDQNSASDVMAKLSSKEQVVANLVAEGYTNKEIAKKLDVQLVTVKKHLSSIFNKLNIKDRVALAILINK